MYVSKIVALVLCEKTDFSSAVEHLQSDLSILRETPSSEDPASGRNIFHSCFCSSLKLC